MKLHANAALTIKQRLEIQQLYTHGQRVKVLAERFGVHETTIRRWIKRESPQDRSSAPRVRRCVVTEDYRNAVIVYRQAHPQAGPIASRVRSTIRIAQALRPAHPQAHRGTVLRILQTAGLTKPQPKKDA